MPKVRFYKASEDYFFKYAVIIARYAGKWVFCKHRDRRTYECPGGHWEKGETIDETAERELYEETGAVDFDLLPVCVYSVTGEKEETFGMLYLAQIHTFGPMPELEIEQRRLFDVLPDEEQWTYPKIQPLLVKRAMEHPEFH
ncbi:NUDIX domain-containing protein [Eubacterium sp. 1001713B170207_170306_E7]|uniref:NUDIX hydrolase n=1 Tax=Eubacterium sp. 1001713B170207_170306_E7 TaxID=2787097 RepID=UPI001898FA64|nr:NUDIX domain-containing protein [Eubacterium sp. 1001713B170207_170306_E7]